MTADGNSTAAASSSVPPPSHEVDHRRRPRLRRRRYSQQQQHDSTMTTITTRRPTALQEALFVKMKHRQLQRDLNGHEHRQTKTHLFALLVVLLLIFGVGVGYFDSNDSLSFTATISFDIWQLVLVAVWFLLCVCLLNVFSDSPYFGAICWMLVYWPLLSMVTALLLYGNANFAQVAASNWILVAFVVAEVVTLVIVLSVHCVYPKFITSTWFATHVGATRYWNLQVIASGSTNSPTTTGSTDSSWTMVYSPTSKYWFWLMRVFARCGCSNKLARQCTCKYQSSSSTTITTANNNNNTFTYGQWMDDDYGGEVLTGLWQCDDGSDTNDTSAGSSIAPVAPFESRQYGTGDAFCAVPIAYYHASTSDKDSFDANALFPSNDGPTIAMGVASVECSVQGAFLKNLPAASPTLYGPKTVAVDTHQEEEEGISSNRQNGLVVDAIANCLTECFGHMTSLKGRRPGGTSDDITTQEQQRQQRTTQITIKADDPRGVEVVGHVYQPTGRSLSAEPTQVVIEIQKDDGEMDDYTAADADDARPTTRRSLTSVRGQDFMPFASYASRNEEHVLVLQEEEEEDNDDDVEANFDNVFPANGDDVVRVVDLQDTTESQERQSFKVQPRAESGWSSLSRRTAFASLQVKDWIPTPHNGALVYFPGFNSPLKQSLETLGQFMAMTKVMEHVRPIIFQWPNGQIVTYRHASAISASERNKELLLQLIRGLALAGIRQVHFLSHSMGVQSMLSGFGDKPDGSRSDVSQCFRLNHAFVGNSCSSVTGSGGDSDEQLMICKSITMVNPDFPIEAFIDHAFLSIRRICSHVTVVGDRQDQALYYSQVINGMCNFFGYAQPPILNKDGKESDGHGQEGRRAAFRPQNVLGRDIESLYFSDGKEAAENGDDEEKASFLVDDRLLFKDAPTIILSHNGQVQDHLWLDVDVIDTTQLDTNIKDLRHSGFNVNPILLNDLEELIVTGRRAINRSTLLFREGNIYSYCHAPSFVTM